MARRENGYQSELIKRIELRFPNCFILKNDEQYCPGIPDLTIFYGSRYAILEVKRGLDEIFKQQQPNQAHYINMFVQMGGIAHFICPENEEEVLDAVQRAFGYRR
jgi:hypothetical protein